MVMPVRPEPVPPGQAIMRPTPAPNGAEAGARHPLSDHQRDDTKVASRDRPEPDRAVHDTYPPGAAQQEEPRAMPARIGEVLDVYV
jgi:hypothetical protein